MVFSQSIDFERSRICWNHESDKSHGSFKVEAVLRVFGVNDDMEELFALGAGVIAGNMYAPGQLVKRPVYLFQIAASYDRHVIFRTYMRSKTFSLKALFGKDREGDSYGTNQLFESLIVDLKSKDSKRLERNEDIAVHYLNQADFSCLIQFPFNGNRRLELEFPIKHLNFHPISKAFQVETGPILFVKSGYVSAENKDLLKELIPCFIHFNSLDRADFSLDFPYGVREPSKRGKIWVEEMKCDIQLLVTDSPNV